MLEKGADVNARDNGGASVLALAAAANNIELARILIAKGANVNNADELGFTPLLFAAGNSDHNAAMVRLLIEHGAQVNVKSADTVETVKNGPLALGHLTPLQFAAQANYEATEALLKAGADINAKDVRNATPLVFAVATDRPNPKIVKLLLDKGADREPALDWARRYQDPAILPLLGLSLAKLEDGAPAASPRRTPREAVAKALAASQPAAANFVMTGGCVSCHADHLNGIAVSAAKPLGIPADYHLEARRAEATATLRGLLDQEMFQLQDPPAGVDGMEFSLMQLAAANVPPSLATDSLVHYTAALQRKEGDWPLFGIVRPPLEDGSFTQTAKGIRVLRFYAIGGRKSEFDERVERAAKWLEAAEPRTTEDRSMQLLGIAWAGHKASSNRTQQLIAKQRADGGWGQTDNLASDAYATGEALWALHETGSDASDPVYRRGVEFFGPHATGRWLVARGHASAGLPAVFSKWLPLRTRPMDFAGRDGHGFYRSFIRGQIGQHSTSGGAAVEIESSGPARKDVPHVPASQHRFPDPPDHCLRFGNGADSCPGAARASDAADARSAHCRLCHRERIA